MAVEDYMLPCINKKIFGIECFGCGTQRAFVLFFNGEFQKAFELFPAIYTMIPLILLVMLHFLDKKRNYVSLILFFGILNSFIVVISYFYRQYQYFNH